MDEGAEPATDPAAVYAALLAYDGIGPVAVQRARDAHGDARALLAAARAGRLDDALGGLRPHLRRALAPAAVARAAARLTSWRRRSDAVLTPDDPAYPPSLAAIHDPPPLLFVRGAPPTGLGGPAGRPRAVAVVGTRHASPWALDFARDLARRLASAGWTVVSGLALGVDGAAHEGALEGASDGTVAVLGAGTDHVHPPAHRALATRIARGGALMAETPPDARVVKGAFPRRNRLVSGLARAVVVVEAPARSGVRHTVDAGLEQGRDVYVVPQRPDSAVGRAACAWLLQGAAPLADAEQLFRDLGVPEADRRAPPARDPAAEAGQAAEAGPDAGGLGDELVRRFGPVGVAGLDRLAPPGASVSAVLAALTALEREGRVAPDGAGRWRLRDGGATRRPDGGSGGREG